MRRRFKLLAALIGVPALLIAGAAVLAPRLVDSDVYKSKLAALVKARTGHTLHVDGALRLHLFPALQVTASNVRLANPAGFSSGDFARLPWLAIDLDLLPLFSGRLRAGAVTVSGLTLNLERDSHGRGNWQSEAANSDAVDDAGQAAGALLAADSFTLREGTLHWHDASRGERIDISDIEVQTGRLRDDGRLDNVRVRATLPGSGAHLEARGDAQLNSAAAALTIPELTAELRDAPAAGMTLGATLTTRLVLDMAAGRLRLDPLRVSARLTGEGDRRASAELIAGLDVDLARGQFSGSTVSLKLPDYSMDGVDGDMTLTGLLSAELGSGAYVLQRLRGSGTVGGAALGGRRAAFAFTGALQAESHKGQLRFAPLEIAGSVDGELPFRWVADLDLSARMRTLTATAMQLAVGEWRTAGDVTVRAPDSPRGVQSTFELRGHDQWMAGSFSALQAAGGGVDVRVDTVADLDFAGGGYRLQGRSALVARAIVHPAGHRWRVDSLQLGARLADAAFRNGRMIVDLRADLLVDPENALLSTDNLRLTVDESHVEGALSVRGPGTPVVRLDLDVDAMDADRYLLPGTGAPRNRPVGVSVDALRALDLAGEVRVGRLTLNGVRMRDVRLRAAGRGG